MESIAPTRKLFVGLSRDIANENELLPLLTNVRGAAGSVTRLPLLRVTINQGRRYAIATYGSRLAALTAKQYLDGRTLQTFAGPRELAVSWALHVGTLKITDLSPEVGKADLQAALSAHGVVEDVAMDLDAMGRHTGTAFVRFRSRAAASRVVKMGQTNLLILGGSVLPPRISIADGAADDEYREGDEATVSPAEDVSTGLSRDLLRDICTALGGGGGTSEAADSRTSAPVVVIKSSGTEAAPVASSSRQRSSSNRASPNTTLEDDDDGALRQRAGHAPTRFARGVTPAHFAQPHSLEFEFALEWRFLQDEEAAERRRLEALQATRRARLLTGQSLAWKAMQTRVENAESLRKWTIALADPVFAEQARRDAIDKLTEVGITAETWSQMRQQLGHHVEDSMHHQQQQHQQQQHHNSSFSDMQHGGPGGPRMNASPMTLQQYSPGTPSPLDGGSGVNVGRGKR